jgi:hypothetical protein
MRGGNSRLLPVPGISHSFCHIYSRNTVSFSLEARCSGTGVRHREAVPRDRESFFGQRPRSVPICGEWNRACSPWSRYATTLPSAFDWRRQPALQNIGPFSSKWLKDGLRSPSAPRRRKQDRQLVKVASIGGSSAVGNAHRPRLRRR